MKITLPKALRRVVFKRALPLELNGFDIDLYLPALFFKILGEGRGRGRVNRDATDIRKYVDKLAAHKDLRGFKDSAGQQVLERLVRTSLIIPGKIGKGHRGEQILSLVPYSILTHKAGLPTESRRQRDADTFVYLALRDRLGGDDRLRAFIKSVFGKGVIVDPLPDLGGRYDASTRIDILTRLSVAFLDGFQPTGVGSARDIKIPFATPGLAEELASDVFAFLYTYHTRMPAQALTHNLLALMNLELFTFSLKSVVALNHLVRDPSVLPPAMQSPPAVSPPELYVDFTGIAGGLSQEMAKAGVRRDLDAYQQFLHSNLLLLHLDRYTESLRRSQRRREEIDAVLGSSDNGAVYLQGLLNLMAHPTISLQLEAAARQDEQNIRDLNLDQENGTEDPMSTWLDLIADPGANDVERVILIMVEAQRRQSVSSFIKWFWGTGGLMKGHGLLRGAPGNRTTWRYAPSNDLLVALVQLAAARPLDAGPATRRNELKPIRLQSFLRFLEERFGLLVDKPPAVFAGPEYTAAAQENLRAMLRRLRQMGIFRDLSDDFTVQQLHPPYL